MARKAKVKVALWLREMWLGCVGRVVCAVYKPSRAVSGLRQKTKQGTQDTVSHLALPLRRNYV